MLATSEDQCAHSEAGPAQEPSVLNRGVTQHVRDVEHLGEATETGSCPSGLLCGALFSDTLALSG